MLPPRGYLECPRLSHVQADTSPVLGNLNLIAEKNTNNQDDIKRGRKKIKPSNFSYLRLVGPVYVVILNSPFKT